ncbi:MAG: response regulator [Acidobacteria bacterium]|nr:response regulator [Acidobacteriota bacterium]
MSRTILLADDSLTIQKVVELTFADTEYEVVAVSSGDELLQRLPDAKPDLVICDVIMPGRDGYQVCQEIKSSSDFLHLPVILLTGTFEPFDRDRAIAVGCSEIITKPFEAKKLVDAVERLAATPASPPPTAADTQDLEPEELGEPVSDFELEDTAVSGETDSADEVAETETASEAEGVETDDVVEEFPDADQLPDETERDFESDSEHDAIEMDTVEFPTIEEPPIVNVEPDPAMTQAMASFDEETDETDVEAITYEPPVPEDFPSDAEDESGPPEAETKTGDTEEFMLDDGTEPDSSLTTPIEVGEVSAEHEAETQFGLADASDESDDESSSDADTQDFGDASPGQAEAEVEGIAKLSDEDIDRIARRLLELATDRIEHIAWDVIPDMAEVVVRERVRELEAEIERDLN